MADASHLEKMCRELKCPVCLSLLESAASITCNHVFCNSCIVKCMKKNSNCPVCKMPFHRREIRPAPHMDNLVGIYKSMETASGINMFMSQCAPSSQLPEKLEKASFPLRNDSQRSSGNPVVSSFPSKKRVQVAQYPLPETPVNSAKVGSRIPEEARQTDGASLKSDHIQNNRYETCLSPFFWLRDDEDAENLSQKSNGTVETDSTPPAAPSFSDLKDSEDESPFIENTQGEFIGMSPAVDLSDNDMLEWTPRPCSLELLSKSTELQIKDVLEEKNKLPSQIRNLYESQPSNDADQLIPGQEKSLATLQQLESAVNSIPKTQNPSKRKKKTTKAKSSSKTTAISLGSFDVDGTLNNCDTADKHNYLPNSEKKVAKKKNKYRKFETTAELGLESNPSAPDEKSCHSTDKVADVELSNRLENGNSGIQTESIKISSRIKSKRILGSCLRSMKRQSEPSKNLEVRDLSENENNKRNDEGSPVCLADNCSAVRKQVSVLLNELSEKKGSHMEVPLVPMTKSFLRSRRQEIRPIKTMSTKKFVGVGRENRGHDHVHHEALQEDSCLRSSNQQHDQKTRALLKDLSQVEDSPAIPSVIIANDILVSGEKTVKHASEPMNSKETRSSKRFKGTFLDVSGNVPISDGTPSNDVQATKDALGNSGEVINDSAVREKSQSLVQQTTLRKCESNLSKVQCAFCQSAEDSKPYGKMIHYLDGRPVSVDHQKGSNLIHCHQICAEWAPNVYFKDDIAINLKAEFGRSRKISCSCCGVKGAALGCYDKSCHRSFHVPCAKLMPECRWDTENYVMLCPLHASSKLPCEMSGSERKRKRASKINNIQERITPADIPKSDWKGDSHRSLERIVLCCSALTVVDKDIVTQFKMLTGVRVSKTWSSSVTHVIASVDENDACRRTLKILMGITEGKWILSVKWLKACIDAKQLVDEQQYEITADIHGIKDGPRLGRLRVLNKEPKLFHGLEFYFCGEFAASYKGYLQDLITAGGGTILHRKPIVTDQSRLSTFIIYNLELPDKYDPCKKDTLLDKRINEANALADSTGAKAVSISWILNCIAACQLLNPDDAPTGC